MCLCLVMDGNMREFRDSSQHFRKSYLLLIIHEAASLCALYRACGLVRIWSAKKVNGLEQWQEVENTIIGHLW